MNKIKGLIDKYIKDVQDFTSNYAQTDASDGKVLSILCYLGILTIIPYLAQNKNSYVTFHSKQGMNIFILFLIGFFAIRIAGVIFPFLVDLLRLIIYGTIFIISLMGIINVCNGKAKELPIVNKVKFIK